VGSSGASCRTKRCSRAAASPGTSATRCASIAPATEAPPSPLSSTTRAQATSAIRGITMCHITSACYATRLRQDSPAPSPPPTTPPYLPILTSRRSSPRPSNRSGPFSPSARRTIDRDNFLSSRGAQRRGICFLVGMLVGGRMSDDMGTFRTRIEIENPARPGVRLALSDVLVDTGSELTWVPRELLEELGVARIKELRFRQANGTVLTRWTGVAIVHAGGTLTGDEVVFSQPSDVVLLSARS